jgi:hypothetical protein
MVTNGTGIARELPLDKPKKRKTNSLAGGPNYTDEKVQEHPEQG